MSWCRSRIKVYARVTLLIALLLIRSQHSRADDDSPAILAAFVNGQDRHVVMQLRHGDGRLLATISDLTAVGIRPWHARIVDGMVALQDISGLTWKLDERAQEIHFTATDGALIANEVGSQEAPATITPSAIGAVLNYDLLGTELDGRTVGSGVFDARVFTPWGVLTNGWISETAPPGQPFQRLGTSLTYSDPDKARSYIAGDVISGGLSWTRPYRLGGFQISSDFALRPDLVTFPIPTFNGRADVPSTVDLFVNSVRQVSQSVETGPFELQRAPLVAGVNSVSLVVRDAAGRESIQSLDFYGSSSLLAPGLASYSVETGYVRQNYGLPGDSYVQPAGSGTVRRGLTPWLTLETHGEMSSSTAMGGIGGAVNLANFGVATLSAAASNPASLIGHSNGRTSGVQYSLGLERAGRIFSFSLSTTRADSKFKDVPANSANPVPANVTRASLGLSFSPYGALHVAYAQITGHAASNALLLSDTPGFTLRSQNAEVLSATFTRPITSSVQLYATGYRDFAAAGAAGITVGLIIPLGQRSSGSVETGMTGGRPTATLNASQAAVVPGDVGWRVTAGANPQSERSGQVSYDTQYGAITGTLVNQGQSVGGRGEITGAFAAMREGVFSANRINDSFAVVDTNGVAGVEVERENRRVGSTNSDGLLLVPDLEAWQVNRLALDPTHLPADVDVGSLRQEVRPPAASGVHVTFAIHQSHSAVIHLVDPQGKPVPVGSVATLVRTGQQVPVGFDGEVFLADLAGDEEVRVTGQFVCSAHFQFKPVKGELTILGAIPCVVQAPP